MAGGSAPSLLWEKPSRHSSVSQEGQTASKPELDFSHLQPVPFQLSSQGVPPPQKPQETPAMAQAVSLTPLFASLPMVDSSTELVNFISKHILSLSASLHLHWFHPGPSCTVSPGLWESVFTLCSSCSLRSSQNHRLKQRPQHHRPLLTAVYFSSPLGDKANPALCPQGAGKQPPLPWQPYSPWLCPRAHLMGVAQTAAAATLDPQPTLPPILLHSRDATDPAASQQELCLCIFVCFLCISPWKVSCSDIETLPVLFNILY